MNKTLWIVGVLALTGCQPKSTSQKIEDKAEDAAHETKQGMERAGEKVKDATH